MVRLFQVQTGKLARDKPLIQQKKAMMSETPPVTVNLYGIELVSREMGWIVGSSGTILELTSKKKWENRSESGVITTALLIDVSIEPTNYNAFAVGQSGTIAKYTSSSDTWALDSQSGAVTTNTLYSLFYASSTLALAVGSNGTIIKYDGSSWSAKSSGVTSSLLGVFISSSYSLAVGYGGVILKSTDNGETWTEQTSGVTNTLWACFIVGSEAWAVGSSGLILHSSDSGETWGTQDSGVSTSLNGIFMFSASFGIIVGDYGVVLSYDGSDWSQEESATPNWMFDVWAVTRDYAVAVGYAGGIFNLKSGTFPNILQDRDGVQINPMSEDPSEVQVFTNEEIRDTNAHNSSIANVIRYKIITVYTSNTLDQDVSIQVKGNRINSVTGAVDIGTAFTVAASDVEARTLTPENEGWLPYIFIEATCSVAPTSGNLNAYCIGRN